jgi:hypothetical protein
MVAQGSAGTGSGEGGGGTGQLHGAQAVLGGQLGQTQPLPIAAGVAVVPPLLGVIIFVVTVEASPELTVPEPLTPTPPSPQAQAQGGQAGPVQAGQAQVQVPGFGVPQTVPPPVLPPPVLPPPVQSHLHGAQLSPGAQAGQVQAQVPLPLPPPLLPPSTAVGGPPEQSHSTAGQSALAGQASGCTQAQPPPEASRA